MFDLKSFIVTNIVNGVKNGTFTKEYGNIMAVNYMVKNVITQDDVEVVSTQIEAWEAEQAATLVPVEPSEEIPVEDLMEENTDFTEDGSVLGEYEATEGDESNSLVNESEKSEELIGVDDDGEPLA